MKNRKRFTAFAFTAAFVFSMVGNMNSLAEEGLYEAETLVTDSTEAETTETEETELTSEESAETELTKEETEETESTESTIVSSVNPSMSTWYDQTFYVTPGETSVFTIKMEDYDDTLALRQVWLTVVDESYNWGTPDESIALISTDGE
ncbi:MAG: hypothetical protein LUH07_13920, partial [Lachnospiraceae bacterium]|nr:hypothetical protein [Lachnospiraceae bacterium]